ncbi:AMP-binding protein [Streptomyces chartreusis]
MFRSEYADVPAVELPIHEAVLGRAAEFGDTPALIDGTDGTTLTYEQLDRFHRRIAAGLAEAGVRKGDILALHSPNTVAFPTAFYAATRAGASVTTVHPLATPEEFAKQLKDSAARWIVTVSPLLESARRAAELAGGVQEIFVCDSAPGHRSLIDMLASAAPEPQVDIDPVADVAALPYSSGTTGIPKGVMLTHRQIATNLAQLEPAISAGPGDRILAVLPFFHIYGLTALMNAPLRVGATVVVLPRFDLETFLAAIQNHRITGLYVAPPIVLALAKHPLVAQYDLSSLKYIVSAAAPLDAKLAAACSQRLGLPPVGQAYGMTELSPGTHVVPLAAIQDAPAGTVGRLIAGTEMRIVSLDDPDKDLGTGESGEILIRGPQVMKGYLGRPDATAAMIASFGTAAVALVSGRRGRLFWDGCGRSCQWSSRSPLLGRLRSLLSVVVAVASFGTAAVALVSRRRSRRRHRPATNRAAASDAPAPCAPAPGRPVPRGRRSPPPQGSQG